MSRPIPFLFCRYEILVGDEVLDASGQLAALTELQGKYYPYGRKAERERRFDSIIMRPRGISENGEAVLSWSVGFRPGLRVGAEYDDRADELNLRAIEDDSVRFSDFVAIPRLRVLAVDDRAGDLHIGGRQAVRRFKSIFRQLEDGDANIMLETDQQDVERALERWRITSFGFTVRPHNPHPPGRLGEKLGVSLKRRGVGRSRGTWEAVPGEKIDPSADDEISAIVELSSAGYGQIDVRGFTPEGHAAHIKKPAFSKDQERNLKNQAKPRELRVYIERETEDDEAFFIDVAKTLMGFYGE
jgi:hypothetical protein